MHPSGQRSGLQTCRKIFTAASVKNGYHTVLKSEAVREQTINNIMKSSDFAAIKNLSAEQKTKVLKTPGEKVIKGLFAYEKVMKETKAVEKNIDSSMERSM